MADYIDSGTVYVDIRCSGQEEGTFYETFENLNAFDWTMDADGFDLSLYITRKHASEGVTALRFDPPTTYDGLGLETQWIDTTYGGQVGVTYYLSYSFYLEEWAGLWGNGDRSGNMPLPGFAMQYGDVNYGGYPFLDALSATTGRMTHSFFFGGGNTTLTAGMWHTIRMKYVTPDGVNFNGEMWLDNASVGTGSGTHLGPYPPVGIDLFNDQGQVGRGVVYIDDMIWSPNVESRYSSSTETVTNPTTTQQWVKIRDKDAGTAAEIKITLPSGESSAHWFSGVYTPNALLSGITNGTSTNSFLTWANCGLKISKVGGVNKWQLNDDTAFGTVTRGWHDIRVQHTAGSSQVNITIDGTLYQPFIDAAHTGTATNISSLTASHVRDRDGSVSTSDTSRWLGFSELAIDLSGPVLNTNYDYRFPMQNVDKLGDVTGLYSPTYTASLGPAGDVASYEEAAHGPGPGLPQLVYSEEGEVYLNFTVSAIEFSNIEAATIYFNLSVSSVEAYYVDEATVYLNLSNTSAELYEGFDAATAYLDMTVLGGECFSTLSGSLLGEGEADARWGSSLDEPRWNGDSLTRWDEGDIVVEGINC